MIATPTVRVAGFLNLRITRRYVNKLAPSSSIDIRWKWTGARSPEIMGHCSQKKEKWQPLTQNRNRPILKLSLVSSNHSSGAGKPLRGRKILGIVGSLPPQLFRGRVPCGLVAVEEGLRFDGLTVSRIIMRFAFVGDMLACSYRMASIGFSCLWAVGARKAVSIAGEQRESALAIWSPYCRRIDVGKSPNYYSLSWLSTTTMPNSNYVPLSVDI